MSLARAAIIAVLTVMLPGIGMAKTIEVGKDKPYKTLAEGMKAAADGDRILIAAGEYFDCANVRLNHVTIEGAGPDGSSVLTDKACNGKALLITAGNDITVRNMTLQRARVPDGNGAGIRAEGTNLTVDHVKFINNEDGILAAPNPASTILIKDSEFIRNGSCQASCAHGIYVNRIKLLRVENSKFFETKQAHHIKSRATRTEVIGCTIEDGPNGTSSYLIEAPNGGDVVIRNNTLEKGPKSENHTSAIMIGAEGVDQPTPEILVENNTFRNDGTYNTFLVANMTATEAILKGNKLSGPVKPLRGDGKVQ
jgi:pectate lyase